VKGYQVWVTVSGVTINPARSQSNQDFNRPNSGPAIMRRLHLLQGHTVALQSKMGGGLQQGKTQIFRRTVEAIQNPQGRATIKSCLIEEFGSPQTEQSQLLKNFA
jgi:hypothetical protein